MLYFLTNLNSSDNHKVLKPLFDFLFSSIPLSNQHEIQRYGKRAPGLDSSKRVNKAVFMN